VKRGARTAGGGLSPHVRLWLVTAGDATPFGQGRWLLLAAIDRTGSLRAAAAELGVSYRKAWGDLRKTEKALGVQLIETRRGGRDGGDTRLTANGRRWLVAYGRFRARVERSVMRAFAATFKDLQP